MVFFIHYRGVGNPLDLATGAAAAIRTTGVPLPQMMPANPTTPSTPPPSARFSGGHTHRRLLGDRQRQCPPSGHHHVGRREINKKSGTNTAAGISFEPLSGGGAQYAAAGPDFSLIASEIEGVMRMMRAQGFTVHCLYNQETDEQPQLYFSHMLATGDALDLAEKIRRGLDMTDSSFMS